ncbi:hypothetical protein CALCODRAFT_517537 [Calocera cornea HHB12733]|uniref:Uncharacterized protein n=1 Tax=Calocera cornea HHB12733 TaxID=1353952 RepID=A0A165FX73_9BASI|nr:hypothetical protein CALCODRAFT_517537 [Calocera cornea HHB12733]
MAQPAQQRGAEATPEQWGRRRPEGGELITRPPAAVQPMVQQRQLGPAMAITGDGVTSLETFPMRRHNHQNYQRLTMGYYRLHQRNGEPLHSRERIHADDPSLAEFAFEHLAPPGSVSSLRHYICRRESIHPSRVRIFIPHAISSSKPDLDRAARWRDPLPINRGNDENWAFKVEVKMHDGEDLHDLRHAAGLGDRVGQGCEECCEGWDAGCRACGLATGRCFRKSYLACAEPLDVCLSSCVFCMRERCCTPSDDAWDRFEDPRLTHPAESCCADIGGCCGGIVLFPLLAITGAVRWLIYYILLCRWFGACCDLTSSSVYHRDMAKVDCVEVCSPEDPCCCLLV